MEKSAALATGATLLESFSYEMSEGVESNLHHPEEIQQPFHS